MSSPELVTITFSHYCEKARWALDHAKISYRESGHLPMFHAVAVRRAGGNRSVPVLVTDDGVINDSTKIVEWIDRQAPNAQLYGRDAAQRQEIERLEEFFDEKLGPHTRRWTFFHLLPNRRLVVDLAKKSPVSSIEKQSLGVLFPVARVLMKQSMKITADGAERSRVKINEVFAEVAQLLRDGRKFLVGESLSAADITFGSLGGVVLAPDEYGGGAAYLPKSEELPPEAQAQIRAWREHPAGQFALRLFRDHRR